MDHDLLDRAISIALFAPYVVGIASAIAALTPTPKDDTFLAKVRKAVDLVALNVKHAKNESPKLRDK